MKITKELAKFNNIKFHDKEHIYYLDKVRTKSVTSIIGEYKHPFDKDYWSQKKADERGISKEEILKAFEGRERFGLCLTILSLDARYEIERMQANWLDSLANDMRDYQEVSEETKELYEEYKEYEEKKKKELKDKYDIYI